MAEESVGAAVQQLTAAEDALDDARRRFTQACDAARLRVFSQYPGRRLPPRDRLAPAQRQALAEMEAAERDLDEVRSWLRRRHT